MRPARLLKRLREGHFTNVRFDDALRLAEALGFGLNRLAGSHHILTRPGVTELINLQDVSGEAKPYQLRQLLALLDRYKLGLKSGP